MKLVCTQENLAKGLSTVSHVVGGKSSTLPILSNILLSTDKGRLKLSATDLEIGINTWIGAKIDEEGQFTLPSRLFTDFVNTNSDKNINLELKNNSLLLKSENSEASIKGIDATEFPLIPTIKKETQIKVPGFSLKQGILQTAFASAVDETRPVLGGVLFRTQGKILILAATDSYRLAEKRLEIEKKSEEEISVVVPSRTIGEVARTIKDDSEVNITVSENQIQFTAGETEIVSRLIEGTFPEYTQIIPKSSTTEIGLQTSAFTNAIKMASFFVRDSGNNVRVKVADSALQIVAVSPQLGENISQVKSEVKGESVEVAFNSKFILDFLSIIDEEQAEFKLSGKFGPGLLKPVKDSSYIYIIMPLRIEE